MPRPRKPWWNEKDKAYMTAIDGKRVILRRPDGSKIGHGDERGVREALARLLAERDAEIRRGLDPPVSDVCRDYLIAVAEENTTETMEGKEWILTKFCEFGQPPYGERPAREIDSTHLHKMRKEWEKQGYVGNTLRRLYREVLACWAWASRPEPERVPIVILESNPLAKMKLPTPTPSKAKYIPLPTVQDLIAFAAARAESLPSVKAHFERQAVLMLRLLAETGCRPKEACSAQWADFDAERGLIVLDPSRHKSGRKTGKPRKIVVPTTIRDELVALRASGYAHPTHLFAHRRSRGEASKGAAMETGAPWGRKGYTAWFKLRLRQAMAAWKDKEGAPKLSEDTTLYWLRHSYLTDAQRVAGAERAADLAGNTKEIARGAYMHVQDDQIIADAEAVARFRESKLSDT